MDGNLATSASRYQKAANVLDAISQSIESAWSVSATYKSQKIAYHIRAMHGAFSYVNIADLSEAAQSMIVASNMAGKAINISKTTVAHAWSYGIFQIMGFPMAMLFGLLCQRYLKYITPFQKRIYILTILVEEYTCRKPCLI